MKARLEKKERQCWSRKTLFAQSSYYNMLVNCGKGEDFAAELNMTAPVFPVWQEGMLTQLRPDFREAI